MRLVTVAASVVLAVSFMAGPAFAGSDLETFNNLIAKRAPDVDAMFGGHFKPKSLCVCDPGGTPISQERMGFVAEQNDIISCWRPVFFQGNLDAVVHCDTPWVLVR